MGKHGEKKMRICHTRDIITPFFPTWMEGYSEDRFMINQTEAQKQQAGKGTRIAQGARDDLLLETLVIESGQIVVFFTLDMIIAEKEFCDYCKSKITKATGLEAKQICISCIHTHNSPLTSHGMNHHQKPDKEYWNRLADQMICAFQLARNHLQPARVFLDEYKIRGYYNNRNRPGEEYFDQCLDLTFKTESGIPLVRLLNLACHPSLIGVQNRYFTSDSFGVMRRYIQGINGTPVMIMNGEAGDVSPRLLKKGVDWNECVRYGEGIGAQLIYPNHPIELKTEEVKIKKITHSIHYHPQESDYLWDKKKELTEKLKGTDQQTKEYELISGCFLYDIEEKLSHDELRYEGDCFIYEFGGFRMVTVPCEIDSVLGKKLRNHDSTPTILQAYSNGFLYYAVNQEEYGKVFESYVTYFPRGSADSMVEKMISRYE